MLNLKKYIRNVPDWPQAGINFKDITPLLVNKKAFREAIDRLAKPYQGKKIDLVAGLDARGFIFAAALAYKLGAGLVIVRKKGKLPCQTISREYKLEYATNTLEMHADAIRPGQKILMADDVLATGGTMGAAIELAEKLKGKIIGVAFLINLKFLNGEKKLKGYRVDSLVEY